MPGIGANPSTLSVVDRKHGQGLHGGRNNDRAAVNCSRWRGEGEVVAPSREEDGGSLQLHPVVAAPTVPPTKKTEVASAAPGRPLHLQFDRIKPSDS